MQGRVYIAAVVLMLFGLVAAPRWSWGQAPEQIGTVIVVENVAEVRTQDATEWERVRFRDAILLNDTMRTGADSKVKVLLRDDSIITLGERSEIEFTEFLLTPERQRTIMSLLIGTVRVITTRLLRAGSATEVHTLNTVAGIRGTDLLVTFTPPDITEVIVRDTETTITVLNQNLPEQVIEVAPNFRTRVTGNAPPTPPAPVPAPEMQGLLQEVSTAPAQVPEAVTPTAALDPLQTPRGATALPTQPQPPLPLQPFPSPLAYQEVNDQVENRDFQEHIRAITTGTITPDSGNSVNEMISGTTGVRIIIPIPR
jgi:FecR protein